MNDGFNQTELDQLKEVIKDQVSASLREEVRPIIREEVRPIIREEVRPIIREEVRSEVFHQLEPIHLKLDEIVENTRKDTDSLAANVIRNTERIEIIEEKVGISVK